MIRAELIHVPEKNSDVVPLFTPQRMVSYFRITENNETYFLLLPAEMPVTLARELTSRMNKGIS